MICRECKTIFGDDEEHLSCDFCFKVWCDCCSEVVELTECSGCGHALCRSCIVAQYDPELDTHELYRYICPNCEEEIHN